jgi:two-component system NarL family response regulator
MSADRPIRVLLVDDHPIVRSGMVALLLRHDMALAGEAANGMEAVALYRETAPDVTLMDLGLPLMDGWEAMARIRQYDPAARIVALSSFGGDEDIHRAIVAGARGYLLKDAPEQDVADAIRAVHAGLRRFGTGVADTLASRADYEALSPREAEVLREIARGKSNKEVAGDLGLTESTVKSHVNSILSKLGAGDRTGAVTLAIQRGLIHL